MSKLPKSFKEATLVFLPLFCFYLFFQAKGIFGGDSGDLVSAATAWGVPHPPGYPLYTLFSALLIRSIPFFSPAWRVALISSFSSSLTASLFFVLVKRLLAHFDQSSVIPAKATSDVAKAGIYKNKNYLYRFLVKPGMTMWLVSLISTLTLAFSYLFWLYAEVAEVFALNSLFIILLTLLAVSWYFKPTKLKFYFFVFFFGLSLTHHHTISFLVPAFLYLFSRKSCHPEVRFNRTEGSPTNAGSGVCQRFFSRLHSFRMTKKSFWLISIFFFLLGLLPYLYLPIAARANPPVDWGHPVDLPRFLALVSRSMYGTFSANSAARQEALLRLIQIPAYFISLNANICSLGIILAFLGAFFLFKKDKILFTFFSLAFLFTGPFFVFFASFPLVGQFLIGTFERFLLLSLPFVVIFLAVGIVGIVGKFVELARLLEKKCTKFSILGSIEKSVHFKNVFVILFFIVPLFLLKSNFKKMYALREDFFADRLGEDILKTVPENSILLLAFDYPLFNTQYVHFALGSRQDVKVFHLFLLKYDYYRDFIKKTYSEIVVPEEKEEKVFLEKFLEENFGKFALYSNVEMVESGWREPVGLLLKYYPDRNSLPSNEEIIKNNRKIWLSYQDLSFLQKNKDYHLTPLGILGVYQSARKRTGQAYLKGQFYKEALEQVREGQKLVLDGESFLYSGTALSKMNRCQEAEEDFFKAIELDEQQKKEAYNLLSLNAKHCWQNEEKAREYEELMKEAKEEEEREPND